MMNDHSNELNEVMRGLTSGRLRRRLDKRKDAGNEKSAEKRKRKEIKSSDECSERMGTLLMQGWTMLGETCPITNAVPLMRDKNGRKYSVALDMYLDELDNDDEEYKEISADSTKEEEEEEVEDIVVDNVKTETPKRTLRSSDECSAEIGTLLMQGWTMLGETCPVTNAVPLMQDTNGRKYSVALGAYLDELEDKDKSTERDANVDSTEVACEKEKTNTTRLRRAIKSNDECSKEIGTLLMQGWTMMGETCPITNAVPLMQDKSGRKYSVALGMYLDELENDGNDDEDVGEKNKDMSVDISTNVSTARPSKPTGLPPSIQMKDEKTCRQETQDLLLKGWTMLNETCPFSKMPLMRDKSGRTYSVALDMYVQNERDETSKNATVFSSKSEVTVDTSSSNARPGDTKQVAVSQRAESRVKGTDVSVMDSTKSPDRVELSTTASSPRRVDEKDAGNVLRRAERSLLSKLEHWRIRLDATDDPLRCVDISKAILECAKSARGVAECAADFP